VKRLPFFYGWLIVAVIFVTMAIGVNARTAFSLFFPPIIGEFGWERGVTAGAFSFGFVVSGIMSPLIGRLMDRYGPRAVMELGVALMGSGLLLAPLTTQRGIFISPSAYWSARAASASVIPGNRCFCRTGSFGVAGSRSELRSRVSALAR